MVYPYVPDEFDSAMTEPPRFFHGQVRIEAFTVALKKGEKRQLYDSGIHKDWTQATAVSLHITPLDPTRKFIDRECVSFGAEFAKVIRPSIQALTDKIAAIRGKKPEEINPLRELNGLYIAGEFVPRPDNKAGDTWTTIKFVDVFANAEECGAHAKAQGEKPAVTIEDVDATAEPQAADPQRAALAQFLPTLWSQAGRDLEKFKALLAANPLLASFTVDSPEVKAVIG